MPLSLIHLHLQPPATTDLFPHHFTFSRMSSMQSDSVWPSESVLLTKHNALRFRQVAQFLSFYCLVLQWSCWSVHRWVTFGFSASENHESGRCSHPHASFWMNRAYSLRWVPRSEPLGHTVIQLFLKCRFLRNCKTSFQNGYTSLHSQQHGGAGIIRALFWRHSTRCVLVSSAGFSSFSW